MERHLEELRQKQRKLTFLLGGTIHRLYKAGAVRFLYTSEGVKEEEEVLRLLRFLDYIEERISKLEQIYSDEGLKQALSQEPEEAQEQETAEEKRR